MTRLRGNQICKDMVSKAKHTKTHVRRMSEGTGNGVVPHMTQDGAGRAIRNYEPAIILPVAQFALDDPSPPPLSIIRSQAPFPLHNLAKTVLGHGETTFANVLLATLAVPGSRSSETGGVPLGGFRVRFASSKRRAEGKKSLTMKGMSWP